MLTVIVLIVIEKNKSVFDSLVLGFGVKRLILYRGVLLGYNGLQYSFVHDCIGLHISTFG